MRLNIRERSVKVATYLKTNSSARLVEIGKAIGISKSSAGRHRRGIRQRGSSYWETKEGSEWLKLLVLGVMYYFGVKQGVGCESLSQFFYGVGLNEQVGSSASALRKLKQEMKAGILVYEKEQTETCHPKEGAGICVGGDETFFGGIPILVMIELASGYILTEVACENRTYDTWLAQTLKWWTVNNWKCHFMVSDGAKALIKLALSGLGTVSIPDLFHEMRALAQPIGKALGLQSKQLQRAEEKLQKRLEKETTEESRHELNQRLEIVNQQSQVLVDAKTTYREALHCLTESIHPFNLDTHESQLLDDLEKRLKVPLDSLSELALLYGKDKARQAIADFKREISGFSQGIHAWWQWMIELLILDSDDIDTRDWVITSLMPWLYWQQQLDKTRHPDLKQRYQIAVSQSYQALLIHPFTSQLTQVQWLYWLSWGQSMADKYQRTSSAVEGRNGYLSRLHHSGRGFSPQTLKVASIIHNFDLKRSDGTTAAQRLFLHPFPPLFPWLVQHVTDIPLPRKSSKLHLLKPSPSLLFPA